MDPYSASKSSAELVIQSYFNSFLLKNNNVDLGIARAGNVIGGGDWSEDRLIPDCVRSWSRKKKVLIRNPKSTRPWQHVLEAVWAYILFAAKLRNNKKLNGQAFNFGPSKGKNYSVLELLKKMKKYWSNVDYVIKKSKKFHESNLLKLNCNKAKLYLGWNSFLTFDQNIKLTSEWYQSFTLTRRKLEIFQFIKSKNIKK